MKRSMRIVATVTFVSLGSLLLQASAPPRGGNTSPIRTIRAVKDLTLHPLTPVTVSLTQGNESSGLVTFKRNTGGSKKQLEYNLYAGPVLIAAEMYIDGEVKRASETKDPIQLLGNEIHIVKSKGAKPFDIEIKPAARPKKRKIRAYKPEDLGQTLLDEEWQVTIVDFLDKPISKASFKKDTDYKTSKLSLQLNDYEITNNKHPNWAYNFNIIKLKTPGDREPREIDRILAGEFRPGDQLEVRLNNARLVPKT